MGLILFLSLNIEFKINNTDKLTKFIIKFGFIKISFTANQIKKIFKSKNNKGTFKDNINEIFKNLERMPLFKNIMKRIVITKSEVTKSIDFTQIELYPFQNAMFYIVTSNISTYLKTNFKSVYEEKYNLVNDDKNFEIDFKIEARSTIFNIIYSIIDYYNKKILRRIKNGSKNTNIIKS